MVRSGGQLRAALGEQARFGLGKDAQAVCRSSARDPIRTHTRPPIWAGMRAAYRHRKVLARRPQRIHQRSPQTPAESWSALVSAATRKKRELPLPSGEWLCQIGAVSTRQWRHGPEDLF